MGGFISTPYFITMGDDKDATITPIFTKDEGLVLSGEYRQHFKDGEFAIAGSFTEAKRSEGDPNNAIVRDDRVRGHLAINGEYHFDETWHTRVDVSRASDKTYLRKFDFFELD